MKGLKGSMTVEAVIVFLLLLCCFMFMLNVAKIAVLEFEMQTIVSDVADRMAGDAYVLGKLNGLQESMDEEQVNDTSVSGFITSASKSSTDVLNALINDEYFSDRTTEDKENKADFKLYKVGLDSIINMLKYAVGEAVDSLYGTFYDRIAGKKNEMIRSIAEGYAVQNVENAMIGFDKRNLQLDVVKTPQTTREFESSAISLAYIAAGISPGTDFEKDDVVISMSYKYVIKLPFFGTHEIILRKTAVEKAWLNGGDGIVNYPRSESNILTELLGDAIGYGFVLLSKENTVYIAGGLPSYHIDKNCRKLADTNYVEVSNKDATNAGYKRCDICG